MSSPLIAPIFRFPRNVSRITRGPPIFLLPLLLVKETAGIISLCLSPVRGSPFRPPSSRRRREEAPTKHLEASFEIKAGTRDLRRRLTSCFAWQCFDPVVIGYRSVTKQSTQQPTARCHGLKRIRARAACTFVHSFRSPHTHTRPAKRERERRKKGKGGELLWLQPYFPQLYSPDFHPDRFPKTSTLQHIDAWRYASMDIQYVQRSSRFLALESTFDVEEKTRDRGNERF